ncbi:M50 family metallopeptidase [Peribacillus muralis]|uniref:M50 family metallopeptidase n=1 Tax=Peribacillus muralis TaxID=264697 RepID=UPI0038300C3A
MPNLKYAVLHPLFCLCCLFFLLASLFVMTADTIYILIGELAAIVIIAIGFHELGHWLLGTLLNMKFKFLAFFCILLTKEEEGKIRCRLNNSLPLSFGVTKMYFDDSLAESKIRQRKILYYAGGPLANFFLITVALLLHSMLDWEKGSFSDVLPYFIILNLSIMIATLVPIEGTDGWNILETIKRTDEQVKGDSQLESFYFRPVHELTTHDIIWLKAKMNGAAKLADVYSTTLLLLHHYLAAHRPEEGNKILQAGLDKMELAQEQEVLRRILVFYKTVMEFYMNGKPSTDGYQELQKITFWYGEAFYTIAQAIIQEPNNKNGRMVAELEKGLSKTGELLDPNQQGILRIVLPSIGKVR